MLHTGAVGVLNMQRAESFYICRDFEAVCVSVSCLSFGSEDRCACRFTLPLYCLLGCLQVNESLSRLVLVRPIAGGVGSMSTVLFGSGLDLSPCRQLQIFKYVPIHAHCITQSSTMQKRQLSSTPTQHYSCMHDACT